MAILINDQKTEQMIRALAQRTGESTAEVIRQSIRQRLAFEDDIAARKRQLKELYAYFDSLPEMNAHLTNEEILGCGEDGLPA